MMLCHRVGMNRVGRIVKVTTTTCATTTATATATNIIIVLGGFPINFWSVASSDSSSHAAVVGSRYCI